MNRGNMCCLTVCALRIFYHIQRGCANKSTVDMKKEKGLRFAQTLDVLDADQFHGKLIRPVMYSTMIAAGTTNMKIGFIHG